MLSRDLSVWPYGGDVPPPAPPLHVDPEQEAGSAIMTPSARFAGQQDTLSLTGPAGAGDQGYTGRDIYADGTAPVPEGRGAFRRLHDEGV